MRIKHQAAAERHHRATQLHAERVQSAHREHLARVAAMRVDHQNRVQEINTLQRGLAEKRPEAVIRYLDLVLESAVYPDGFPHSWTLRYTSSSGLLHIDYQLPTVDVVPKVKAFKYAKSAGTVNTTARPATQIRAVYASVVQQTALRVVHEILESDRQALVKTVVFNGRVHSTDPATGRNVRRCLIAVATTRERFLEVDLSRIDTSACLEHLEARVSKDPSKLIAVEPIELAGLLEADLTVGEDDQVLMAVPELSPTNEQSPHLRDVSDSAHKDLAPGQNHPLVTSEVRLELLTPGVDLSALLVGANGRVARDDDFIFYNNPRSLGGAVSLTSDSAVVDLDLVAEQHDRVVLVLSSGDGGVLPAPLARLRSIDGPSLGFQPGNAEEVSAMVWGELYRRNNQWRLRAVGQGWKDGLAGLARDFGVDVD